MTTLADIEKAAQAFSAKRQLLAERVTELNAAIESAKRQYLRGIKTAVGQCADAGSHLSNLVEGAPELFIKPRTVIFHGVKCGWNKGKGGLDIHDPARTLELIKKHMGDDAPLYISVKESPNKTAINQLSAVDIKRIGVVVIDTDDKVVVAPVDSEVDKMVDALLKDALTAEVV